MPGPAVPERQVLGVAREKRRASDAQRPVAQIFDVAAAQCADEIGQDRKGEERDDENRRGEVTAPHHQIGKKGQRRCAHRAGRTEPKSALGRGPPVSAQTPSMIIASAGAS